MQQREERHEVVRGAQGSCKGEIHKPWDRARWNGNSKVRGVDEAKRVQGSGVKHSCEGRTVRTS
eukprot:1561588-Pleurochrysis_carterae.AAC.1